MADEQQQETTDATEQVLLIDGEEYDLSSNDLTFGEQRDLRTLVRELTGDPKVDFTEAPLMDALPALVTVLKRRAQPDYPVEQALALKWDEVLQERPVDPTPPAGEPSKTSAKRGTRNSTG
jgi:hypothetical protein